jgi:hypothetical protein
MLCRCCEKINWNKVILAAVIYTIIATFIHQVEVFLTIDYYMMPQYFGAWSKVMMPKAGPPPMEFYLMSLAFTFITGVVLAGFYEIVKEQLPKSKWERTVCFTKTVILLSLVFFTLPVYLLVNFPVILLIDWFISGALIIFLSSIIFIKVLK